MEKLPTFLNRIGGKKSSVQEAPLDAISKNPLKQEEIENISLRTDKIIKRFLELEQQHNKEITKKVNNIMNQGSKNESFRKLRIPETYLNNELVRVLHQKRSDTFSSKLITELKRSVMKLQKTDSEGTANRIEAIFRGAESVISAIDGLKDPTRIKKLNIKDQFIGTNDSLDASQGIDLMEVFEDNDGEISINLVQVKSRTESAEKNEQYINQHKDYIESLPDMTQAIVEKILEKETIALLKDLQKDTEQKKETVSEFGAEIREIMIVIGIALEDNPNASITVKDLEGISYDAKKLSTLKLGSETMSLIKKIFGTDELIDEKLIEIGESCHLSEKDIHDVYASWKQGGTVQKPRIIQSIIMNKSEIELIADITNNKVEIVFS